MNLLEITNINTIFLMMGFLFSGIILIVGVFLFLATRNKKEEKQLIQEVFKDALFLKLSETFQKELERLIKEETEKIVFENKEKIQKASDEIIQSYQKNLIKVTEEIDSASKKLGLELASEKNKFREKMNIFGQEVDNKISQLLEVGLKVEKEILKESKKEMEILAEKTKEEISRLQEISKETQKSLLKEGQEQANRLAQNLSYEISQIYQSIKETLNEKIKRTEKEIEDYKKEKFKEIDQKIYQMLGETAKKTIGKTIDLSTHEELVIDALEKAKKEKFF